MSYSNLTNKELQQLQNDYRKGTIKEDQIPNDQLMDLKDLYRNQIEWLEKSIEIDRLEIINIRNRLKN